jgi:hypothetical protein
MEGSIPVPIGNGTSWNALTNMFDIDESQPQGVFEAYDRQMACLKGKPNIRQSRKRPLYCARTPRHGEVFPPNAFLPFDSSGRIDRCPEHDPFQARLEGRPA